MTTYNPFHDPLTKRPNSQDSQRVTPLPASEFKDVPLFVAAPSIDEVVAEQIRQKAQRLTEGRTVESLSADDADLLEQTQRTQEIAQQLSGRNHKIGAPEDEIVYVIARPGHPDGPLVESIGDTEAKFNDENGEPFQVVNYLKLINDNLPPSKSTGSRNRRRRNR